MPIGINGNGTITGVTVGGLPDGIVDTDMLAANAVSSAKLASGVGGKIIQVVQAVKTDTFTHSTETFTDVTGLSVAITPSSTSNKILIHYSGCMGGEQNRSGHIRLVRVIGGTTTTNLFVGDQGATTAQARASSTCSHAQTYFLSDFSGEFLDSPSTTSAITYKLQLASGDEGTNQRIGRTHDNSNEFSRSKTPSSITVFEVAA